MSDYLDIDTNFQQDSQQLENHNFELGSAFFQGGRFKKSIPYLQKSLQENLDKKNYDSYVDCYNLLIQAFSETYDIENLNNLYQEFEKNSENFPISENIKTLICSAYYHLQLLTVFKNNNLQNNNPSVQEHEELKDKVLGLLTKALDQSLDKHTLHSKGDDHLKHLQSKMDVMNCLYMFTNYFFLNNEFEKAIKNLNNLKILLDYYFHLKEDFQLDRSKTDNIQDQKKYRDILEVIQKKYQYIYRMKLGAKSLEALIECFYKKDFSKSESILWEVYEMASKTNNAYIIPYVFTYLAYNYSSDDQKNLAQAEIFLNLAEKNIDPDRKFFVNFLKTFKETTKFNANLNKLGERDSYDIVFSEDDHVVIEKQKGRVNFKNQFILLEILKLLMSHQGSHYSKQNLVEEIWKQEYSPSTHDNKIYVTIKRLRELLEPDISKPKYICRSSRGYYLTDKIRILMK